MGVIALKKIIEKIKNIFKKEKRNNELTLKIYLAREELMDAERSFNETTDMDYIDVAIHNLNLAKKKYELCIKDAKSLYKAS